MTPLSSEKPLSRIAAHLRGLRKVRSILPLRNSRANKVCVVMAHGPSVTQQVVSTVSSLLRSRQIELIALNDHHLLDFRKCLGPDYWVFSDPFDFSTIAEVSAGSDLERLARIREMRAEYLRHFSNSALVIPHNRDRQMVSGLHKTYYFLNWRAPRFVRNVIPTLPFSYVDLTSYKAVAFAQYLGYAEIHLAGFDNNRHHYLDTTPGTWKWRANSHAFSNPGYLSVQATSLEKLMREDLRAKRDLSLFDRRRLRWIGPHDPKLNIRSSTIIAWP